MAVARRDQVVAADLATRVYDDLNSVAAHGQSYRKPMASSRTHTHLKQGSAFAARRLHVHNDSMVNEGEVMIVGYDHVQVAIPSGAEPVARDYYGGLLGMVELPKPAALAARGGCWFTAGAAVLHLGVEADFRAARKAHPAFIVKDLDAVGRTVRLAGHETTRSDDEIQGVLRFHTFDPFGNRLEFQQA
jgi:hypothetical protein